MQNTEPVWRNVDKRRAAYAAFSDRVWGMPELCYQEVKSCAEHTAMLEAEGFRITRNVVGIPTAVMGEWGDSGPVIAVLGEYDALPELSQEAGLAEHKPMSGSSNGHACGHNLLGAGALLAAAAVKEWLQATGTKGRVRYYGCPAEEGGGAKGYMVRDGAFDDVDIAISWHPAVFSGVNEPISLACRETIFSFVGRASHAAAAPHLGRSALDAVELMSVGVNYMREHVPQDARMHYAYLDAGGVAPNVVQGRAKVTYLLRAREFSTVDMLCARVAKVAQGAALMTETSVSSEIVSAYSNLLPNPPLEQLMYDNFMRLGPPPFTDADRQYAAEIQKTLRPDDIEAAYKRAGLPIETGKSLCDLIVPFGSKGAGLIGSTDLGDVSWKVPTVYARGATMAIGTPGHSWQVTAQGKTAAAHTGMVHVAKVMAGTAIDAFTDPRHIADAKADHAKRTGGKPYVCPIPADSKPPFDMRPMAAAAG
jgi:aminobenzoyl-glutamate utilization protein B